jgi:hypothetical protein
VDFGTGRIFNAQFMPSDQGRADFGNRSGGPIQGGGPSPINRAIRSCQTAVERRLGDTGFGNISVRSIRVDDRPGRNGWIVGDATADGRDNRAAFDFSCSVDLADGDIRNVDVQRRYR